MHHKKLCACVCNLLANLEAAMARASAPAKEEALAVMSARALASALELAMATV